MNSEKVRDFMEVAGQPLGVDARKAPKALRELAAQLLVSEVLEYAVKGLGVRISVGGKEIQDPNGLEYNGEENKVDQLEMLDGLSDVAYTMYWNALAFGLPLEKAFEKVCQNNLEKFVELESSSQFRPGAVDRDDWGLGLNVHWPTEVVSVEILTIGEKRFAVGKDLSGKVRKPSTYQSVSLEEFVSS